MDAYHFGDEAARARALSALQKLQIFRGLSDEERGKILEICNGYLFFEDEIIFTEGDPSHDLFVLLTGAVDIVASGTGRIGTLRADEILGEMGMICQIPRTATAVVRERAGVLRIGKKEFDALLDREPRLGVTVLRTIVEFLTKRLVRSNEERGV